MPLAADLYYAEHNGADPLAPPVVLIHGAGGSHLDWPLEIRRLPGYHLYVVDLPGHGRSQGSGCQSIQAYAEALLAWHAALNLPQVAWVGHSMGSAVALWLGRYAPQTVRGLGLLGGGARLRVNPDLLEAAPNEFTFPQAVAQIIAWSYGAGTPAATLELATERLSTTRPAVLHGDLVACNAFDLTGELTEIRKPVLALTGSEDRMTPPRYAQFLGQSLPYATLQILPGAGHMLMIEQPEAVASALGAFLSSL